MDFLKKNSSSNDDDIIELTDIIEKGQEDSSAAKGQNQAVETQMNNLFSTGNKDEQPVVPDDIDADLDALLADMQPSAGTDGQPHSKTAASAEAATSNLNVNEKLDMPNMAEVDALLEGLDIPPQPENKAAATTPTANGAELDDLLNDMLDTASPASPRAPKAAAAEQAAPTEKATEIDLDDLDALFAKNSPKPEPAKTAEPAPEPAPAASSGTPLDLDDLDALFAAKSPAPEADKKSAPLPEAAPAASSGAAMNLDDLDALFASEATQNTAPALSSPAPEAAPSGPAHPKKTEELSPDEELSLDEDLDALLGVPKASSAPAAAEIADNGPETSQLDDSDTTLSANKPAPSSPNSKPRFQSLEDDLDAILGSVDAPKATKAAPPLPAKQVDEKTEEDADMNDLGAPIAVSEEFLATIFANDKDNDPTTSGMDDDLLAGLDVLDGLDGADGTDGTDATDDAMQSSDPKIFEKIAAMQSQKVAEHPAPTTLETQDVAMLSASKLADMPSSNSIEGQDLPELDELDLVLGTAQTRQKQNAHEDQPPAAEEAALEFDQNQFPELSKDTQALDSDVSFEEEFSDEDIARAAQELLDDKVRAEASLDNVDTNAWLSSLDEVLEETTPEHSSTEPAADPMTSFSGDDVITLDKLLSHLPDSEESPQYVYSSDVQRVQDTLQDTADAAAPSTSAAQAGVMTQSKFDDKYAQELARLQNITERFASNLAEADARITTLTQNARSEVALEAMFRADSPFNASLQHAVRAALATELRSSGTEECLPSDNSQGQQSLAALREKINVLEGGLHTLQEQIAPLEEGLRKAQEHISALEDGNKEARLQTVETRLDGQAERTLALEKHYRQLELRLEEQTHNQAELEQRFQHEVEKAAAAAAARIIREEIAGILAEH